MFTLMYPNKESGVHLLKAYEKEHMKTTKRSFNPQMSTQMYRKYN